MAGRQADACMHASWCHCSSICFPGFGFGCRFGSQLRAFARDACTDACMHAGVLVVSLWGLTSPRWPLFFKVYAAGETPARSAQACKHSCNAGLQVQ